MLGPSTSLVLTVTPREGTGRGSVSEVPGRVRAPGRNSCSVNYFTSLTLGVVVFPVDVSNGGVRDGNVSVEGPGITAKCRGAGVQRRHLRVAWGLWTPHLKVKNLHNHDSGPEWQFVVN